MHSLFLFLSLAAPAQVPAAWTCDPASFGDDVCDCGCGAQDADCSSLNFSVCERSGCRDNRAPWEHTNYSCMAAVCGDGWRSGNEACDDGDRLDSGGCTAACDAVSPGFECGEAFRGCTDASGSAGEGEGEGEGEEVGNGADGRGNDDGSANEGDAAGAGCAATPVSTSLCGLFALPAGFIFRRRAQRSPREHSHG